jgi:hypothetical protein
LLKTEALELNQYVRMYFQTYVAWFTFFITVLFTSMAWALKSAFDEDRRLKWGLPVYLVHGLYVIQIIFGVIATGVVYQDIQRTDERILQIQRALAQNVELAPRSPVPRSFAFALVLMGSTLLTNLVFWSIVVGAVRRLERRLRSGAVDSAGAEIQPT